MRAKELICICVADVVLCMHGPSLESLTRVRTCVCQLRGIIRAAGLCTVVWSHEDDDAIIYP